MHLCRTSRSAACGERQADGTGLKVCRASTRGASSGASVASASACTIALIGIIALVPAPRGVATSQTSLRTEFGAFRSRQVWLSLIVTVLGFGGMFGAFTYIAFLLTEVSGFASATVPWLLILFGVGTFLGNILGGKAADRSRDRTITVFLAGLTVVLAAFALLAANPVATVILLALMGGFGFGTVPGLQTRIMHFADHAPTLASSSNIAAFNVGNALGAWLGGITITAGLGYTSPLWVGAALTLAALVVMLIALRLSTSAGRMSRATASQTAAAS